MQDGVLLKGNLSMDVFVGNLSDRIDAGALERIFQKLCKNAQVKFFKEQSNGAKMRYACVSANPRRHAKRAIKLLSNTTVDGEILLVREYHHRASFNERRAIGWRKLTRKGLEKRIHDRRGYFVEKFNSGVHLVEMKVIDRSQGAPRAKDKKTLPPAQLTSLGRQA